MLVGLHQVLQCSALYCVYMYVVSSHSFFLSLQAYLMDERGRFTIPVDPVISHKVYDSSKCVSLPPFLPPSFPPSIPPSPPTRMSLTHSLTCSRTHFSPSLPSPPLPSLHPSLHHSLHPPSLRGPLSWNSEDLSTGQD